MTQDYKEKLLKYLTGNLTIESGNDEPLFNREENIINKNLKSDISDSLHEKENATDVFIYGKIFNQKSENFLVYGRYTKSSNFYGYVVIVDKSLNIISVLTEFKSGTKIYPFISLQQDENGKFYGLTHDYSNINSNYRICLFNDILNSGLLNNTYSIVLRQTYLIPNSSNYRFSTPRQNRIIKLINESTYYITMHNTLSQTIIIKFTINVGVENEWQELTINYLLDTVIFSIIPDKSSGETIIYFYGLDILTNTTTTFRQYSINDTTINEIYNYNFNTTVSANLSQVYSDSINKAYISLHDTTNNIIKLFSFENGMINKLWESTNTQNTDYLYLENVNNITFIKSKQSNSTTSRIYVGMIKNNNTYFHEVYNTAYYTGSILEYIDFYIICNFNLYNMYIPDYNLSNKTYNLLMTYNDNNYNGTEYENINSLSPQSAILFDNEEEPNLIFARNLYNLSINGNTTISTVEIPNTMLNNVTILNKSLYSKTNTVLCYDIKQLTKNIYETVDINFINTLTMQDNDNSNNLMGASRLNISTSSTNDYSNAQIGYYRLNYTDGTSADFKINPSEYTPIDEYSGTYNFVVYVKKALNNINILSNDKTTVYATLNLVLDVDKYYKITQNVEVI